MPEKTDEEIVALVQKRDVNAFGFLVERYENKIMRYAKKFLLSRNDAKDLVQEVFIKAYSNIQSFDTSRRFSPWIYRIAHNEFINDIKKKNRLKTVSIFDFDVFSPHLVAKETAAGNLEREETREMIDKCLDGLPLKYREPLILFYFEDLSYQEISDILRIPVSTIGVRLKRGRKMLKEMVAKFIK